MRRSFLSFSSLIFSSSFLLNTATAQSSNGYIGYSLDQTGDPDSTLYETANGQLGNGSDSYPPPDVFLNASVSVGEIDLDVQNLSAQINIQAQVLSLLDFNAGVSASIDEVRLTIQNVTAKVILEARLGNLVTMIGDVLDSIDLNPVIATLGQDVGEIVNNTVGGIVGGGSGGNGTNVTARGLDGEGFELEQGILYSINDYSGNTHTNRVLQQDGTLINELLDNDGVVSSTQVVGTYLTEMTFNGYNISTTVDGAPARELEYVYHPVPGVSAICAIFVGEDGSVLQTSIIAETRAGGGSTIDGELKS